jgi:hypothetical protein
MRRNALWCDHGFRIVDIESQTEMVEEQVRIMSCPSRYYKWDGDHLASQPVKSGKPPSE